MNQTCANPCEPTRGRVRVCVQPHLHAWAFASACAHATTHARVAAVRSAPLGRNKYGVELGSVQGCPCTALLKSPYSQSAAAPSRRTLLSL
eukprot:2146756-Pleurochrysis_carterae.AAC.2